MTVDLREFLMAIRQEEGQANTTTIKAATGLNSSQIHYRYDLAEERGYIELFQPEPKDGQARAKVAKLTEAGDKWLRKRTSTEKLDTETVTVSKAEIDRLHDRIDELENRVNAINELQQEIHHMSRISVPYVRQLAHMIRGGHFSDWDGVTIDDFDYDYDY